MMKLPFLNSSNPAIDVDGAVVVITGGARGIGAATAELFASRGAQVWIGDVDADVAAQTAARLGIRSAHLDVTSRSSWTGFVETVIGEAGRIDVLVNNAGVMPVGPFEDESDATTDLMLDVNVRGLLLGMRAVLPLMRDAGVGHVINVASLAGMIPLPGMVTYNASKYAALGASLAARREYDGTGVTVSAILPSAVRTELASGAKLGGVLPTVDPEDVARAIVRSVRVRAPRTSVPGWIAPGWVLVDAFVPEFIERIARRFAGERQAMALDAGERRAYLDRIDRQSRDHAADKSEAGA
ncbi:putative short chain dehydrogenase/reductase [Gordonia spumicola]|uniref:Putative short chain dehydrogenase/reductase n=1 Tax=Gordonia spumicola TaxID=589161 RepID=A0A7I9VDM4_9ACTN|nr:SDR family oxidoreductase [Gordonia spumicola]GEE03404.1 putative short chain dehydrogenase/reductase [Gordonia spumicola]